ncbi:hypothetical protein P691DRAFT_780737 [Macrolepiota fuliginosa MF-IS2]|uniref:Uncharacterized protein n=1 Tax=Macrolepiota fuliginosa MF-IS2 TaxID=1400762 RepID=A0A9P5XCQ3_9AGAR|nr:hypothetical protein P691DRAFT_780737 [Macrolepiota fuliginosa MF-IS2]
MHLKDIAGSSRLPSVAKFSIVKRGEDRRDSHTTVVLRWCRCKGGARLLEGVICGNTREDVKRPPSAISLSFSDGTTAPARMLNPYRCPTAFWALPPLITGVKLIAGERCFWHPLAFNERPLVADPEAGRTVLVDQLSDWWFTQARPDCRYRSNQFGIRVRMGKKIRKGLHQDFPSRRLMTNAGVI